MVTFVVELASSRGMGGRYQMRNDFNDKVKRRDDDLLALAGYAFEYVAYQDSDLAFDLPDRDYAKLASSLGRSDMPGFDLGL